MCSWSYNFIPVSHAPPVGSYNIFDGKKKSGPASFDKSKRFDDLKGNRVFDNNLSVKLRLQILASSWYSSTEAKLYGWRKGNTFNTEFSLIIVGFNPYVDSLTPFSTMDLCVRCLGRIWGEGATILYFSLPHHEFVLKLTTDLLKIQALVHLTQEYLILVSRSL